jgi:hypothetical protein
MAHDYDRTFLRAAPAKERLETRHHSRLPNALAIDLPLQTLPGELAFGQKSNGVAQGLFAPGERLIDQPPALCQRAEYLVVGDDSVIEIDSDPECRFHGQYDVGRSTRSQSSVWLLIQRAASATVAKLPNRCGSRSVCFTRT